MVPRVACCWLAGSSLYGEGKGAFGNQRPEQKAMLLTSWMLLLTVQHHRSLLKHLILATGDMGILLMNKSQFGSLRTLQSFNENAKITTIKKKGSAIRAMQRSADRCTHKGNPSLNPPSPTFARLLQGKLRAGFKDNIKPELRTFPQVAGFSRLSQVYTTQFSSL